MVLDGTAEFPSPDATSPDATMKSYQQIETGEVDAHEEALVSVETRRSTVVKVIGGITAVMGVAAVYNHVGASVSAPATTLAASAPGPTESWKLRSDVQAMQKLKVRPSPPRCCSCRACTPCCCRLRRRTRRACGVVHGPSRKSGEKATFVARCLGLPWLDTPTWSIVTCLLSTPFFTIYARRSGRATPRRATGSS